MHKVLPASYANRLLVSIPEAYYWITLTVFVVVSLIFVSRFGLKRGLKWGLNLLLAEYVFLLYCSTVFFRPASSGIGFNVIPFKTYKEILCGKEFLLSQSIMNVVVFVPIGLLLGMVVKKWSVALTIGVLISLCIEMLQYLLAKGYCEIDDVVHNTLGCLLGIGIYLLGRRCYLMLR